MQLSRNTAIEILRQHTVLLSRGSCNIDWDEDPNAKVQIHQSKNTDGYIRHSSICMPPPSDRLDAQHWQVHRGMLTSLRSRAMHADMGLIQNDSSFQHPYAKDFTEIIERARCDKRVSDEMIGERLNIDAAWDHAVNKWMDAAESYGEAEVAQMFAEAPHHAHRAALEAEFQGLYKKGLDPKLIPEESRKWAKQYYDTHAADLLSGNTANSKAASEQIAKQWEPPEQPPEPPPSGGDGDGDQSPPSGSGDGDGSGDQQNPAQRSVGQDMDDIAQEMAMTPEELKEVQAERQKGDHTSAPPVYEHLYNQDHMEIRTLKQHNDKYGSRSNYTKALDVYAWVRKQTMGLAGRARQHLLSVSKTKSLKDQTAGALDEDKLSSLALSIPARYFEEQSIERKVNTAVCLILDGSGSMDWSHYDYGGQQCTAYDIMLASTLSTIKLLHSLDISVGTYMFCDNMDGGMVQFTDYRDKTLGSKAVKEIARAEWDGGTPLGEAMKLAAPALLERKEPRKIMLTLTDGGANGMDPRTPKRLLTKAGVECYGFGIGYDGVTKIYGEKNSVVIYSSDELKRGMIKLFENIIGKANVQTTRT